MSWFSDLFKKKPKNSRYAPSLEGWLPIFSQFGTDIYASDVVQQALNCIVTEMKKLNPTHIRNVEGDPIPIRDSDVQKVLNNPNPLMTASDFLEKTTWLLLMNYNVFILPTFYEWRDKKTGEVRRRYDGLYPLNPIQVNFLVDASDRTFVEFEFRNGYSTTILYSDVIHIRRNYSLNDYMGGNEMGQPDHKGLLKTLELNQTLLEGVAKAMKASYSVNGILKINTLLDDGHTEEELRKLEEKVRSNESGFAVTDLKTEFNPLPRNVQLVDEPTLKFIDEKILRHFGVPLCILRGDYTKEQFAAFYQHTLEDMVISFGQAFTKKLFTPRELSYGNEIKLYPKELIFMTPEQTIELVNLLAPTGAMYENEKRAALGLRPMPELVGKRYMSLNWIEAQNASQYQVGKENVEVVDEVKEEE